METITADYNSRVQSNGHVVKEGKVAKKIESITAKVPSDVFLWSALAALGVSLGMYLMGSKHRALLAGQLAPTFLILGLYNKLVKLEGHDQQDKTV